MQFNLPIKPEINFRTSAKFYNCQQKIKFRSATFAAQNFWSLTADLVWKIKYSWSPPQIPNPFHLPMIG